MEIKAEIEKYKLNRKVKIKPPVGGSGGGTTSAAAMYVDDEDADVASPRFVPSDDDEEMDVQMTYQQY